MVACTSDAHFVVPSTYLQHLQSLGRRFLAPDRSHGRNLAEGLRCRIRQGRSFGRSYGTGSDQRGEEEAENRRGVATGEFGDVSRSDPIAEVALAVQAEAALNLTRGYRRAVGVVVTEGARSDLGPGSANVPRGN